MNVDTPCTLDWAVVAPIIVDVALPSLSILVPTAIALLLFRAERRNARASENRARRMDASGDVIRALAPMASIQPDEPMQERLWELRARIAVYRAWIEPGHLSGDWLALRHREGMIGWSAALTKIDAAGGPDQLPAAALADILEPAHTWAARTIEMLSSWIRGDLPEQKLRDDGARIISELGPPPHG